MSSQGDQVAEFIETFRARAPFSVLSKLDVLIDRDTHDPRVLPFSLDVPEDSRELTPVQLHLLERLRNGGLAQMPGRRSQAQFSVARRSLQPGPARAGRTGLGGVQRFYAVRTAANLTHAMKGIDEQAFDRLRLDTNISAHPRKRAAAWSASDDYASPAASPRRSATL
jgi:hypothetical protein